MLQIGDQLGDTAIETFAREMAKMLHENNWTDFSKTESVLNALMSLNSNIKSLVFLEYGKNYGDMRHIVQHWPLAMQLVRFYKTRLLSDLISTAKRIIHVSSREGLRNCLTVGSIAACVQIT